GRQHPDRSDVLAARQPLERHWTAARAPAGSTVRRLAAHLGRAAEPQPLRPLRSADAQAAGAALRPHRDHAPRQWRTRAVHRNQAQAVQARLDLLATESVGMHFGTFQLTTEGIDEPLRALEEACRARDIPPTRFRTLPFGASLRLPAT